MEVPEDSILATGTADPLADTRTQNIIELPEYGMTRPEGDGDLVHGELMTFANAGFDLPPIDRLEAFDPNGRCVYTRVLVAVESKDLIRPVWLYNYKLGHNAKRITSGKWGESAEMVFLHDRVDRCIAYWYIIQK
ncbi:MAG: gamma-glutamylcyclotransferase [Candidatus Thiodiazotropha sp.]